MPSIYFGGSRFFSQSTTPQILLHVLAAGESVHVGCSTGADQTVLSHCLNSSAFSQVKAFAAFAAPVPSPSLSGLLFPGSCGVSNIKGIQAFALAGGSVSWLAGGSLSLPLAARLIRRSIAAFQGCESAVFFAPGAGSLAVAAHAIKAGLSVYSFSQSAPAPIAGSNGIWCISWLHGLQCWQWGIYPQSTKQLSLF